MGQLDITLHENETNFTPSQTVAGAVRWQLESNPHRIEVSLSWYTSGKGTRDVGVAESLTIHNPGNSGSRDFTFRLPEGPYSFSGNLVSLSWAVEATSFPSKETTRHEIIVSPTGHQILLREAVPGASVIAGILTQ